MPPTARREPYASTRRRPRYSKRSKCCELVLAVSSAPRFGRTSDGWHKCCCRANKLALSCHVSHQGSIGVGLGSNGGSNLGELKRTLPYRTQNSVVREHHVGSSPTSDTKKFLQNSHSFDAQ